MIMKISIPKDSPEDEYRYIVATARYVGGEMKIPYEIRADNNRVTFFFANGTGRGDQDSFVSQIRKIVKPGHYQIGCAPLNQYFSIGGNGSC